MSDDTNFSGDISALAKALAAAQAEMQDAKKDTKNPHFKSMFASLASVRAAVVPTLAKHGLSIVQLHEPASASGVCVVTMLMHESGQWIRSKMFVPVTKADAQGIGSAQSYARRYSLAAIACIGSDDDDDGEAAVQPARPAPKAAAPSSEPTVIEKQLAASIDWLDWEKEQAAAMRAARSKGELAEAWTLATDEGKGAPNGTMARLAKVKDALKANFTAANASP